MRSICALVMVAAMSSSAGADVSKAWQAAKDNLPDTIPAIGAIDVAAVVKLPAFAKLMQLGELREGLEMIKRTCNVDVPQAIDGVVVAGDPNQRDDEIVVFLQLKIDRAKASTCFEQVMRSLDKGGQVSVQQTGMFTEVSVDGSNAYFAWVDKNVVAFNFDPISKTRLSSSLGKKGLAKSPAGSLFGKLDLKAAAFGAIKLAPLRDLPFTAAYGNATLTGATLAGAVVGTATDPAAAGKFVTEAKRELVKLALRDKLPAVAKKLVTSVTLNAVGAEVTLKGSAATGDLVDALVEMTTKKKRPMYVDPPPPPAP